MAEYKLLNISYMFKQIYGPITFNYRMTQKELNCIAIKERLGVK